MHQDYKQMIVPKYDSIAFFGFNSHCTLVWNNGKVGVISCEYSNECIESVPCMYDEGKIFEYNYSTYEGECLLIRKGKKWGVIDWRGTIEVDFTHDTIEDVKKAFF
jgi:hypothetical protein